MDTLFFWVSKLVWLLVAPDSLLLVLMLLAWLLLLRRRYRAASLLGGLAAVSFFLIALLPLGDWLLYPLEARFATSPALPETVHGIIVLGGAEDGELSHLWQQPQTNDAGERFTAFMALARRYPAARLVFTGGSGNPFDQTLRGADVARELLHGQGMDLSRVLFERESRNTWENAIRSRALVDTEPGQPWVLITSAGHMPRAVGVFCRAGWTVLPYPVDHRSRRGHLLQPGWNPSGNLETLKIGLREWLGLLAYRISGKSDALLPDGCG